MKRSMIAAIMAAGLAIAPTMSFAQTATPHSGKMDKMEKGSKMEKKSTGTTGSAHGNTGNSMSGPNSPNSSNPNAVEGRTGGGAGAGH